LLLDDALSDFRHCRQSAFPEKAQLARRDNTCDHVYEAPVDADFTQGFAMLAPSDMR
jgi:hypothetical protein